VEGAPIAVADVRARGQAETATGTLAGHDEPDSLVAMGEVRNRPLPRFRARDVIASSCWTGRRSLRDQVLIVEAFGPLALNSVHQLAAAIEERRLNDPATSEALDALKELHQALGDLIARAEQAKPMKAAWKRVERSKERLTNALWDGAQVMVVAPILAVGTATILSFLSGFPVSEGMVTALCATGMGKDAILTLAKRK
jgi:hypothetical protein